MNVYGCVVMCVTDSVAGDITDPEAFSTNGQVHLPRPSGVCSCVLLLLLLLLLLLCERERGGKVYTYNNVQTITYCTLV